MKKSVKKIIILALIFILCATMILSSVAIAFGAEKDLAISINSDNKKIYSFSNDKIIVDGKYAYDLWVEFSNKYIDRTSGTLGEKAVAEYLKMEFVELGLSDYNGSYFQNFSQHIDNSDGTGEVLYSQNVVGIQKSKNGNGKQIVIGAHYDNSHNLHKDVKSNGAYDNASGVINVLTMASVLRDFEFDFDIVYVMYGMEELGLFGSSAFVNKLSDMDKDNILLKLNFDSTICGDYVYAYTDEIARTHEKVFFESDESIGTNVLRKFPSDKKAILNISGDTFFTHIGHQSDNYPFLKAKINAISFVGYNLESNAVIGMEKDGSTDIMHTTNDNVEKILRLYGEDFVTKRLTDVPSVAMTTIIRNDFANLMVESHENNTTPYFFFEKWFIGAVYGAVVALFILGVVLVMNKLKKEKIEPIPQEQATFSKENIFDFSDEINKNEDEQESQKYVEDDDIFGLK